MLIWISCLANYAEQCIPIIPHFLLRCISALTATQGLHCIAPHLRPHQNCNWSESRTGEKCTIVQSVFNREALEHNCIQLIGNAVKICGWSDSGVDRAHMYRSRIVLKRVGGSARALHLQSDSGLLGRETAAWNNEPLPSYSPLYEQHNNTTTAHSNTTTQFSNNTTPIKGRATQQNYSQQKNNDTCHGTMNPSHCPLGCTIQCCITVYWSVKIFITLRSVMLQLGECVSTCPVRQLYVFSVWRKTLSLDGQTIIITMFSLVIFALIQILGFPILLFFLLLLGVKRVPIKYQSIRQVPVN